MKIKFNSKQSKQSSSIKPCNSRELSKPKKKPILIHSPQLIMKTSVQDNLPKYIALNTQPSKPKKKKSKKLPKQESQFFREFQEITQIYKRSREVENQEDIDLMCLDETLEDQGKGRKRGISYYSISNRYSQKSATLLPSIAQKDHQEDRDDDLIQTIIKPKQRSPLTTATNHRAKTAKSAHDNYVNDFDLKTKSKSREKKVTLDVQRVIISRQKTKSSISQKHSHRQCRR